MSYKLNYENMWEGLKETIKAELDRLDADIPKNRNKPIVYQRMTKNADNLSLVWAAILDEENREHRLRNKLSINDDVPHRRDVHVQVDNCVDVKKVSKLNRIPLSNPKKEIKWLVWYSSYYFNRWFWAYPQQVTKEYSQ